MRPVLLEMEGFATFREPTVVSFDDADYFALVGPTGAGKSTLLDAITFALYRTVARWNDESMVSPALAPTTTRGVVRLIFDVSGHRYSVAREIRRSRGKNSSVSVKSSRLERLTNPEALTNSETEILASDSEVTPAVEKLLGLTFKHFSTCVALPQGAFAEFLHVKSGERQKILANLLGLDVYSDIARAAGARASEERGRAETLTGNLANYGDTSEAALLELTTRTRKLQELDTSLTSQLATLTAALADASTAQTTVANLTGQLDLLATVEVPGDVADLNTEHADAARAEATAATAVAETQATARTAQDKLRAGPDRAVLERIRRDWAEHAAAVSAIPAAADAAERTKAALASADVAHQVAAGTLVAAQEQARDAHAAAVAADAELSAAEAADAALRAVIAPDGITDLVDGHRLATDAALAAANAVREAEEAETSARGKLAQAADAAALATAIGHAAALRRNLQSDADTAADRATSTAALTEAHAHVAQTKQALDKADAALNAAHAADTAQILRQQLQVGHACPVCDQAVHEIPARAGDHLGHAQSDADAARRVHQAAIAKLDTATRTDDRLTGDHRHTLQAAEHARSQLVIVLTGELDGALQNWQAAAFPLTSALTGESTPAELSTTGQGLDRIEAVLTGLGTARRALAVAAEDASTDLAAARSTTRAAAAAVTENEAGHRAVMAALRTAREQLLPYEPPTLDDSAGVAAGWHTLIRWALSEADRRRTGLETARAASLSNRALTAQQDKTVTAAETAVARHATTRTAAVRAAERAATELGVLITRRDTLAEALAGALSAADAADQLKLVVELTLAVDQAQAAVEEAQGRHRLGSERLRAATERVHESRRLLTRIRDPLASHGAPLAHDDNILTAWTTLTEWSTELASRTRTDLEVATAALSRAADASAAAEARIRTALAEHQLVLPQAAGTDHDLLTHVPVILARAIEAAHGAEQRMTERLQTVASIQTQIADAQEQGQVARQLATLMRTDGFPQWLNISALDSLVAEASDVLAELSGGQFALAHAAGDFWVVDHNEADALRPVKTLSGGETFQASLALALALSSQMRSLAAAGAAQLESIFLDEGFGTLDEATLDTVAGTLENLATSGSRMVGLVTHVAALADRVPVRFAITRDAAGSHISRETA